MALLGLLRPGCAGRRESPRRACEGLTRSRRGSGGRRENPRCDLSRHTEAGSPTPRRVCGPRRGVLVQLGVARQARFPLGFRQIRESAPGARGRWSEGEETLGGRAGDPKDSQTQRGGREGVRECVCVAGMGAESRKQPLSSGDRVHP